MGSGGGLPLTFSILGGATLSVSSVLPSAYSLSFSVSGVTYNGSYLDTINGAPFSGPPTNATPGDFYPYGSQNGVLKLIDTSSYVTGVTLIDYFNANGVVVNTDSTGSATITFNAPVKPSYQFQLLYQTYWGTYNSIAGNLRSDLITPYNISFTPPSYSPDGLFSVDTVNVTPIAATYTSVQLIGARYNGELLGSTGSIVFYQNQGSSGTTLGGNVSDANGITLNTISNFSSGLKTANMLYPGPTFDTARGEYYMVYYLNGTSTSSNYVNVPEIDLPVDALTSYDTVDYPGVTLVTLTNLTYNFRQLNPGDSVGISQAGAPFITRSVSPARSVTYAAVNARRSSGVYYSSPATGLSKRAYSTPVYSSVPEYLGATLRSRTNLTSNTNDGFRINFSFDYKDTDGYSIFSRGSTGIIHVRGINAADGFSEDIPCSGAGNYSASVSKNLTSSAGTAGFNLSFYDLKTGALRTATNTLNTYWAGLITVDERMGSNARGFMQAGDTFLYYINSFDYKDAYSYSIFSPNYVQRSSSSGVTSAPYTFNTQNVVQGGTHVNINNTGLYSFGITAGAPFFPGSAIVGGDGANTFAGTVFLSTLSTVVINCTTFSSHASSNKWGITGTYAEYHGTTGIISIIQSPGVTLTTFPYQYGISNYSGISNRGVSGSAPGTTYGVYFSDFSGMRTSFLPLLIQNMTTVGPSGNTGYGPNGNPGATGTTYLNGNGTNAVLRFDYMYDASAGSTAQYQVLGELAGPLPYDYSVSINVPAADMSRMLIYQSAWNIIDEGNNGMTLQGFLGGAAGGGATGVTLIDPLTGEQVLTAGSTAYYGPHVALLLGSVLDNVQLYDSGNYTTKNRLTNLDSYLSTTGATGSSPTFSDDGGSAIAPIGKVYGSKSFVGATAGVLSSLPSEAIASLTNTGFVITQLKNLLVDIDTRTAGETASYVPALHNIFEQAVAYGKVDGLIPIAVSDVGFASSSGTTLDSGIAMAWNNGVPIHGVSFAPGDTATLYVKYAMDKTRQFQVSPWVTQGLDANLFSVGQVLSINVGGTALVLPLDGWLTEKTDTQYVTYALNLVATENTATSNFDA